ncbi:MAG: MoaD/ThiS family protein [Chloroflexi bacterium]|nr:MoaD/ThiS family protein [Chloroflexota bacterium]
MPRVQVHFYATLRSLLGQKTVEVDLPPGATVRDLVHALVQAHPELRAQLLRDDGSLEPSVHIFLNGRDYHYFPQGADTPITEENLKIDIFPPVGGGGTSG